MISAIINASPIIALSILNKLDLLWQIFDKVYIPQTVVNEILSPSGKTIGKQELKSAIETAKLIPYIVKDRELVTKLYGKLHRGELEVIIGAKELNTDFAIIDEISARKLAKVMSVDTIGTVGILKIAKNKNLITDLKPLLLLLIKNKFRISEKLIDKILRDVNEI